MYFTSLIKRTDNFFNSLSFEKLKEFRKIQYINVIIGILCFGIKQSCNFFLAFYKIYVPFGEKFNKIITISSESTRPSFWPFFNVSLRNESNEIFTTIFLIKVSFCLWRFLWSISFTSWRCIFCCCYIENETKYQKIFLCKLPLFFKKSYHNRNWKKTTTTERQSLGRILTVQIILV